MNLKDAPPPPSTDEGFYPDPLGTHAERKWDGKKWTQYTRGGPAGKPGAAASAAAKGGGKSQTKEAAADAPTASDDSGSGSWLGGAWHGYRGLPTWLQIVVPIVLLFVIAGIAGGDESDKSSSGDGEKTVAEKQDTVTADTQTQAPTPAPAADSSTSDEASCGPEATDDCTPHVAPNGTVRVDALNWKLDSAETAATVGDQSFGAGETANGVYVVADLSVKSDKDESATIIDDVVTLEVNGNSYSVDTDGSTALELSGGKTFFLNDIGPDSTLSGTVVFDVPPKVLNQKPELVFHELGFGETKGYIALPPLS